VVSGIAAPAEIEQAYIQQGIFAFMEKQTFDRRAFLRTVRAALEITRTGPGELEGLSAREQEVLGYLARGLTNKAIAEALVISPNTVKRHVKAIYRKLDIHTRSAAAARAVSAED
jgi:DNA-binding NarL/FixJ family response regulator